MGNLRGGRGGQTKKERKMLKRKEGSRAHFIVVVKYIRRNVS